MNHFYRNIIYFVTVFSSAVLKINASNEFPRPTGPYPVVNVEYIWINDLNIKEQDHKFYKKIDAEKIGIFGFSFVGSIATRMTTDSRIKAAINLDGGVYSQNAPTGVNSPFMFITGNSQAKEKHWTEIIFEKCH